MPYSRTLDLLHARGQQGTGSFQSWHANEYQVRGDPARLQILPNPTEGPLGLFPRLDVHPGAASALNDGIQMKEWGQWILPGTNHVSNADLDFELDHAALQGYKTGTGGDNAFAPINRFPKEFAVRNREWTSTVSTDTMDHQVAEATSGWHAVDKSTVALQKQRNFDHNKGFMGIDESGRHRGLEQDWNKAIYPKNPRTVPLSTDTTVPMESPDEINVNGEAVNTEDTLTLGIWG
jgi:hypothetical protein